MAAWRQAPFGRSHDASDIRPGLSFDSILFYIVPNRLNSVPKDSFDAHQSHPTDGLAALITSLSASSGQSPDGHGGSWPLKETATPGGAPAVSQSRSIVARRPLRGQRPRQCIVDPSTKEHDDDPVHPSHGRQPTTRDSSMTWRYAAFQTGHSTTTSATSAGSLHSWAAPSDMSIRAVQLAPNQGR